MPAAGAAGDVSITAPHLDAGPDRERDDAPPSLRSPAEQLFVEFLASRLHGDGADFEGLCAAHPRWADELRRLHERWEDDVAPMLHSILGDDFADTLAGALAAPAAQSVQPAALSVDIDPGRGTEKTPDELVERLTAHQRGAHRYRHEGEIGRGGMGAVYRVWDENLHRLLAMKVMLPREVEGDHAAGDSAPAARSGSSPTRRAAWALAQFLSEALVTGQLDHPGIVPVHELGRDEHGRVFFTMKLVKGRNLRTIFKEVARGEGGWTLNRAVGATLRVCEAVAYAHSKGVIHRDIKPDNIMVGKYGETYLIDWGLAKLLPDGSNGRRSGSVSRPVEPEPELADEDQSGPDAWWLSRDRPDAGTPVYMSPEQAWGRHELVDERTDIYSLGAILYHLLSGQMPYVDPGPPPLRLEIVLKVRREAPRRLRELAPNAPPSLVAICERAMAREIEQRYPSVAEMAADLEDYLEDISEAREEARRQARRAELINEFLVGMLSSGDPEHAQGREITVRDVLDEAAHRIQTALPDHPLDEAALRLTIGNLYKQLGHYDRAEGHLARSLELTDALLGPGHADTVAARYAMGLLRWHQGRLAEAEEHLRAALAVQERDLGPDHPDTLGTLFSLSLVLQRGNARLDEAEQLMNRTLRGRRALYGDDHAATLESLNGLALLLSERGRLDEAASVQRRVLEGRLRVQGESHPSTLNSMNNLARLLQLTGRAAEATAILRRTLEHDRRVLGESHPSTLTSMNNLATSLQRQGGLDEAAALLEHACEQALTRLGADHTTTLSFLNNLAGLREDQGRLGDAEALYRESVERADRTLSPDHRYTARFRTNLAGCLLRRGRARAAAAELALAHPVLVAALGPNHDWTREAAEALDRARAAAASEP